MYLQLFLLSYCLLYLRNLQYSNSKFLMVSFRFSFPIWNEAIVFFIFSNLTSTVSALQSVTSRSEAAVRSNFQNVHYIIISLDYYFHCTGSLIWFLLITPHNSFLKHGHEKNEKNAFCFCFFLFLFRIKEADFTHTYISEVWRPMLCIQLHEISYIGIRILQLCGTYQAKKHALA